MSIIVSLPVWLIAALLGLWAVMLLKLVRDNDYPPKLGLRLALFSILLLLATSASGWLALYIARNAP